MRRRRVIIVFAPCVLLGFGVFAFWPAPREPEYNGRKLSEWLEIYQAGRLGTLGVVESRERAGTAIAQIGTNALPWLIKWLRCERREPAQWKRILFRIACNLHFNGARVWTAPDGSKFYTANNSVAGWLLRNRDYDLAEDAAHFGFPLLGSQAALAIPDLLELRRNTTDLMANSRVDRAIMNIPEPVYELSQMLTNQPLSMRRCSARALYRLSRFGQKYPGIDLNVAILSLAKATRDPDVQVREYVTNALCVIAPEVLKNGIRDF